VRCPNCAFWIPKDQRTNPEVRYGDRILVLKYLYLFQEPRRWDVVVFKSPDDPKYEQNYIKRLIGNPGESILILDGDIYVGKGNDTSTFAIQTKPRYVQNALWRNIYDNDYYPLGLTRKDQWEMNKIEPFKQPWTVSDGAGWDGPTKPDAPEPAGQRRNFTFDNLQGSGTIASIRRPIPLRPSTTTSCTTSMAHRFRLSRWGICAEVFLRAPGGRWEAEAAHQQGRGRVYRRDRATKARLVHERGKEQSVIGEAALRPGKSPLEVEFSNHDYRVELRIGGSEVLATTPQQYHPDVKRLLTDYEIGRPRMLPTVLLSARISAVGFHI
jgi:signal peptidase I